MKRREKLTVREGESKAVGRRIIGMCSMSERLRRHYMNRQGK